MHDGTEVIDIKQTKLNYNIIRFSLYHFRGVFKFNSMLQQNQYEIHCRQRNLWSSVNFHFYDLDWWTKQKSKVNKT